MEWYYVLAIIAVFVALVGVLIYLGRKGYISADMLGYFRNLVSSLSDLVDCFGSYAAQNPTVLVMDKAMELLEKAVYAAENLWYNGEITAEERYDNCVQIFSDLLNAYDIELPDSFALILNSAIAAICEGMGHMRTTKGGIAVALTTAMETAQ